MGDASKVCDPRAFDGSDGGSFKVERLAAGSFDGDTTSFPSVTNDENVKVGSLENESNDRRNPFNDKDDCLREASCDTEGERIQKPSDDQGGNLNVGGEQHEGDSMASHSKEKEDNARVATDENDGSDAAFGDPTDLES